jgi:hypothetical protein
MLVRVSTRAIAAAAAVLICLVVLPAELVEELASAVGTCGPAAATECCGLSAVTSTAAVTARIATPVTRWPRVTRREGAAA